MAMDGNNPSRVDPCTTQSLPGGRDMRVLVTNAYAPYELKWGQWRVATPCLSAPPSCRRGPCT
jgi:hypothetical protein